MKRLFLSLLTLGFAFSSFAGLAPTGKANLGYTLMGGVDVNISPADSTTFFLGWIQGANLATRQTYANVEMVAPRAGTIKKVVFLLFNNSATGTGESVTHSIRVNDTTDTVLDSAATWNQTIATTKVFSYDTSIVLAAGDTVAFKIVTPAWATNPTGCQGTVILYIE